MFLLAGEQRYFEETLPVSELKELLDSGSMSSSRGQADRIRGLKWLLAMISKGTDVSRFFPDVIRNIMTMNFELKKLAYMYVLHYCDHDEQSRSTALLSINAFQRDLSDESELIRGLALRTLTSIRVRDILEVQFLAIKTSCRDPSPYVRKIVANSVSKLNIRNQFEDSVLAVLIVDSNPSVMGSAAQAMLQICPDRFDLVHVAFDRLCLVLHDVDEFGQVALLKLLSRYVRHAFTSPVLWEEEEAEDLSSAILPSRLSHRHQQQPVDNILVAKRKLPTKRELDSFLNDEEEAEEEKQPSSTSPPAAAAPVFAIAAKPAPAPLTASHKRLLQLSLSLLKSRNSGVVMAAAHTSWYCGQRSSVALKQVAQALVRLVKSPLREVGYFAIQSLIPLVRERPRVFAIEDFFIVESDLWQVKMRKLELIAFLVKPLTLDQVLGEMELYAQNKNQAFAARAVRTLGVIVERHPGIAMDCLQGLSSIVFSETPYPLLVREEAIAVARAILARKKPAVIAEEVEDFLSIDFTTSVPSLSSKGKVNLLWLARRFHAQCEDEVGDMLRDVAQTFCEESVEVKLEALSLAKTLLKQDAATRVVAEYVLSLGAADSSVEVRDWSRFLLCNDGVVADAGWEESLKSSTAAAASLPLELKSADFEIDSLSFALGTAVNGYEPIPDWSLKPRTFAAAPQSSSSSRATGFEQKRKQNQAILSSSSSSSEEEEEEEEDSSSSGEGSSSEEESSSSSDQEEAPPVKPFAAPAPAPALPSSTIAPVASVALKPQPAPLSPPPAPVEFKLLLSNVRGHGLQVEHGFPRLQAPRGWTSVVLKISNKHVDGIFSNIRLERSEHVLPLFDPIPSLAVGFHREDLIVHVNFQGLWRSAAKLVLLCDETGKVPLELKPPAGELLLPASEALDFDKHQRQLAGMNQVSSSFSFRPRSSTTAMPLTMAQVRLAVWRAGNYGAPISEFDASTSSNLLDLDLVQNSLRFAARRSDATDSLVLVEIQWDTTEGGDGTQVTLCVNCEYALAGQTLLDEIKASLLAI